MPSSAIKYADNPATCGLDIDVPERVALAVSESIPTERIETPGAKISTLAPKLEKLAMASVEASIAPTVIAVGAEAGDVFPAST